MRRSGRPWWCCVAIAGAVHCALVGAVAAAPAAAAVGMAGVPRAKVAAPAEPQPIMPLDQVRRGMKGYGLTVFAGTTIEPFAVEVISVQRDNTPQRGVIWVMCPDERMMHTGPVQGMSGSPIYLWDDEGEHEVGKGGKLIGAFAFGYPLGKDCLVGVQPIELMRQVADRTAADVAKGLGEPEAALGHTTNTAAALAALGELQRATASRDVAWRAEAARRLISGETTRPNEPGAAATATAPNLPPPPGPAGEATGVVPLGLVVGVSQRTAWMDRLFAPAGLRVLNAGPAGVPGLLGAQPPANADPDTPIAPGSVLSVPLAWGDLDLAGIGTATDVLPDGTVLAFGHAMFAEGPTRVPMASGYVHTIVAHLMASFKMGGSLRPAGALVRDENSAVAGVPGAGFASSPVTIELVVEGQPRGTYHYEMARHPRLAPFILGMLAMESVGAEHQVPAEHTIRVTGTVGVSGGEDLQLQSVVAGDGVEAAVGSLIPPIVTLTQNPLAPASITSASLKFEVDYALRRLMLLDARLDRAEVAPGQDVNISVRMRRYDGGVETRTVTLHVPADAPDGQYPITVCDASSYAGRLMGMRPHLFNVRTPAELRDAVQRLVNIRADALYALLQLPAPSLAVGPVEMPKLPSSRAALLTSPTGMTATPYAQWQEERVVLDAVVMGDLTLNVNVRRPFRAP